MPGIYQGPSDGFTEIVDGYEEYAKNVIATRAIPDFKDGLKKVQRRIIYTGHLNRSKNMVKCSTMVGRIMEIHPHGDQATYGALCLLTDENGGCNVPFFDGGGNLGKVYLSDKPAAMRYPMSAINDNGEDFFRDEEIMEYVPSEEGDGVEPPILLAPYPVVLVNGAMGIAVATGTNMPSFNFYDVIDLTSKYIKEGLTISDVIKPDFSTGGILVSNDQEITKIMLTGKGKLKIRAKVEIVGKEIRVLEVPYGKTVQSIIKSVRAAEIREVAHASEATGRDSNFLVRIECKTKRSVEGVLMELYSKNILQNTFSSSILVVDDGNPLILGVHDIIKKWVEWRKEVLQKKFDYVIAGNQSRASVLSYFIRLCNNTEQRDEYLYLLVNKTVKEADDYLRGIFEGIPEGVVKWIHDRRASAFNRSGKYQKEFDDLNSTIELYKNYKSHPEEYILKELEDIRASKKGMYQRKTEISYQDYKFSKIVDADEIEDTSYCVYTLFADGFLVKSRMKVADNGKSILNVIKAKANSVLIGFDNYGRLLRVMGKDIPFTQFGDNGVYLPKYFDAAFQEDYRVLYLGLLDGSRRMLLYRDGYIGFFDTSEFVGKKNIKVVTNGVPLAVMDKLLHVFEEDEIPPALLLCDDSGSKMKIGIVASHEIPVRSRTSRAKVLTGSDINVEHFYPTFGVELTRLLPNFNSYVGKLKVLRDDVNGDVDLEDGRYLDICEDFE